MTTFEAGKSPFVSLIFIFFADTWKVKQNYTVECQKLVTDIVNSLVADSCNTMAVGNYISPGNRLKYFCEEMLLCRDTDSFMDSCVAICQFLLECWAVMMFQEKLGKRKCRVVFT